MRFCMAVNGGFICNRPRGHEGDHQDTSPNGGCVGWKNARSCGSALRFPNGNQKLASMMGQPIDITQCSDIELENRRLNPEWFLPINKRRIRDELDRIRMEAIRESMRRTPLRDAWAYTPNPFDPTTWKFPIDTAAHVRNAIHRFPLAQIPDSEAQDRARTLIGAAAVKFGIAKLGDYIPELNLLVIAGRNSEMQLRLAGTNSLPDGTLQIILSEGSWSKVVNRSSDGSFTCHEMQCQWKKDTTACEHVRFAREQYESVIAPSERQKAEEEMRVAMAKLEQARAVVARLERNVPVEEPKAPEPIVLGGSRRIVVKE